MKMMKKLMALVLASALALTLLTGCGGGGGGKTVIVVPGGADISGDISNGGTAGGGTTGGTVDAGSGTITVNGNTATIGGVDNENTMFSQTFIALLSQGGMEVSYSKERGRQAQKFIRASVELMKSNPNEDEGTISVMALQKAGINLNKEMIFATDATDTKGQLEDIIAQIGELEQTLGRNVDCDGNTFGYTTLTGRNYETGETETILYVVVGYTLR